MSAGDKTGRRNREGGRNWGVNRGVALMARFEILDSSTAPLGEGPAAGDVLFELGVKERQFSKALAAALEISFETTVMVAETAPAGRENGYGLSWRFFQPWQSIAQPGQTGGRTSVCWSKGGR